MIWRFQVLAIVLLLLPPGCAPLVQVPGPSIDAPMVDGDIVTMRDGAKLPMRHWSATGQPRAIIIAVHGFNDYSRSFAMAGHFWAARGVTTYAYDQRGFGAAPYPGLWPGRDTLGNDLEDVAAAIHRRHPATPLYLLGESMGSAVILTSVSRPAESGLPGVKGVVLGAPAVWGGDTLNPFYRGVLWVSSHVAPWKTLTGRGLGVQPSDNIAMLRALGRDPLVIKATRIDTIAGLVHLMDAALADAPKMRLPALVLYGAHDQIIPRESIQQMLEGLTDRHRIVFYPDGWHMLFRDTQASVVWRDVLAWVEDSTAALPSGMELERASLPHTASAD